MIWKCMVAVKLTNVQSSTWQGRWLGCMLWILIWLGLQASSQGLDDIKGFGQPLAGLLIHLWVSLPLSLSLSIYFLSPSLQQGILSLLIMAITMPASLWPLPATFVLLKQHCFPPLLLFSLLICSPSFWLASLFLLQPCPDSPPGISVCLSYTWIRTGLSPQMAFLSLLKVSSSLNSITSPTTP